MIHNNEASVYFWQKLVNVYRIWSIETFKARIEARILIRTLAPSLGSLIEVHLNVKYRLFQNVTALYFQTEFKKFVGSRFFFLEF